MSASPAANITGLTPNGSDQPPLLRRPKPKHADPLRRPMKKKPPRPAGQPPNSVNVGLSKNPIALAGRPAPPQTRVSPAPLSQLDSLKEKTGFTDPASSWKYVDYPVRMTKRALKEQMRIHVARLASKKFVDPRNENEFTRPVRLHRRDPRQRPVGSEGVDTPMNGGEDGDEGDDKERETRDAQRLERERKREADMAQVAPGLHTGSQKKSMYSNKKKTQQFFQKAQTEEQKAISKLRYEEALPWHLEDFDNKQTWVGTYEAALSETHAMLIKGEDNVYRLTPLDKWYKFMAKQQFRILTTEEAEKHMGQKVKEPRWLMETQKALQVKKEEQAVARASKGLFVGRQTMETEDTKFNTFKGDAAVDELDFEEDFADDEENATMDGPDEETKEAEERIKRDQLKANAFDMKDEGLYEKEEQFEKLQKEIARAHGKKVRKALMRREGQNVYDTDSDSNPYSSGESEDSEEEAERLKEEEEERKKKEEEEAEEKKGIPTIKTTGDASGSSTKGSNTPSGRPSKHGNGIKRTNSPTVSEASGNESSRKKQKQQHPSQSTSSSSLLQPRAASSTPKPSTPPVSRPRSPALSTASQPDQAQRKPLSSLNGTSGTAASAALVAKQHKRPRPVGGSGPGGAGSGSDAEAGSGGEMSDGTRKRLKLNPPGSKHATPQASRAQSPEAGVRAAVIGGAGKPRAASPDSSADTALGSRYPSGKPAYSNADQLREFITNDGISLTDLMNRFAPLTKNTKELFRKDVIKVGKFDKDTKKVFPHSK
ncbi:hypothetical protein MMC25_000370 [Agyrium rufum]|nr:hypothetical protein [Agyrium rufum]